ncbi:hypothetical protein [Pseudomonas sp. FP2338]|uniref:hypothetical protein n=1 Tax=Pseudomonas sp. FP2338 TaxID=2954093 RepID=UPI00273312DF|nr:hypothetical protein [Pseudomonas sp. FP2338]WLH86041.1 hypothetical protein PSH96_06225 [Pseudomonas sp. FP2338]
MAFNTGNPVEPNGSRDPRDLIDNAQIADKLINSSDLTWFGRLGKALKTWAGMTAEHNAAQVQRTAEFQAFLQNIRFEVPVSYAAGINITRSTQTVLYNGQVYRPKPEALPFVTTTFPADEAKWLLAGDSTLRQDLAASTGAGRSGFDSALEYAPATVGFELANLVRPGAKKQQRTFADFMMLQNLGNLDQLNKALMARVCTVVIFSDSIAEGDRDGLEDNSVVLRIMALLRDQNPSITWNFANFSLAGRGISALSSSSYVGMSPPEDNAVGFYRPSGNAYNCAWPGGSVVGKTWLNHGRDLNPDLVILMSGANDTTGDGNTNASQIIAVLDTMAGWTKPPSVALAPAALPASTYGYQDAIQVSANVMRGIARSRGLTLLDINRLFHLHRYAKDVDNCTYVRDNGFSGYPSGWTASGGTTFAQSGVPGYALQGVGSALRNNLAQDLNQSGLFTMPNWSTQVGQLIYRSLGSPATQYIAQVTGNAVQLYFGAIQLASYPVSPAIPNGTGVTLRVDVRGCRHRVFLNAIKVIEFWSYAQPLAGKYGVGIVGALGTVENSIVHVGNPRQYGTPELSDTDIYGYSPEEFATNPNSLGGNGINHPTALANTLIWTASFAPLLHHIRAARNVKVVDAINPVAVTDSGNFATASTTVTMQIDGNSGFPGAVVVASTGATAACHLARIVSVSNADPAGRTIIVRVQHSTGASYLTSNVQLPVGNWMVTANAVLSKDAANTVFNSLLITAVRVS